jgi:hypothetical protein
MMGMGYWDRWLIGGKIIIAGIIAGIPTAIAYIVFGGLARWANKAWAYGLAGLLTLLIFAFVYIYMLGYFSNKFWKFK